MTGSASSTVREVWEPTGSSRTSSGALPPAPWNLSSSRTPAMWSSGMTRSTRAPAAHPQGVPGQHVRPGHGGGLHAEHQDDRIEVQDEEHRVHGGPVAYQERHPDRLDDAHEGEPVHRRRLRARVPERPVFRAHLVASPPDPQPEAAEHLRLVRGQPAAAPGRLPCHPVVPVRDGLRRRVRHGVCRDVRGARRPRPSRDPRHRLPYRLGLGGREVGEEGLEEALVGRARGRPWPALASSAGRQSASARAAASDPGVGGVGVRQCRRGARTPRRARSAAPGRRGRGPYGGHQPVPLLGRGGRLHEGEQFAVLGGHGGVGGVIAQLGEEVGQFGRELVIGRQTCRPRPGRAAWPAAACGP